MQPRESSAHKQKSALSLFSCSQREICLHFALLETQSHRTTQVGKDLQDPQAQPQPIPTVPTDHVTSTILEHLDTTLVEALCAHPQGAYMQKVTLAEPGLWELLLEVGTRSQTVSAECDLWCGS